MIDMNQLQGIIGNDQGVLFRFLLLFINATEALLTDLSKAIQSENLELSKAKAHRLKGSTGNCGASQMHLIALKLENAVLHSHWSQAQQCLDAEKKAFKTIKKFFKSLTP